MDEYFQFMLWKEQMRLLVPLIAAIVFLVISGLTILWRACSIGWREYRRQQKAERENRAAWNEPPSDRVTKWRPWSERKNDFQ